MARKPRSMKAPAAETDTAGAATPAASDAAGTGSADTREPSTSTDGGAPGSGSGAGSDPAGSPKAANGPDGAATAVVRISARRDGFRRCGVAHSKAPRDWPAGSFTADELEVLRAEPNLSVEDIPAEPGK